MGIFKWLFGRDEAYREPEPEVDPDAIASPRIRAAAQVEPTASGNLLDLRGSEINCITPGMTARRIIVAGCTDLFAVEPGRLPGTGPVQSGCSCGIDQCPSFPRSRRRNLMKASACGARVDVPATIGGSRSARQVNFSAHVPMIASTEAASL